MEAGARNRTMAKRVVFIKRAKEEKGIKMYT
jgi:hypothetical protein